MIKWNDRPNPALPFEKNRQIKIWIDGTLYPREEAKISVLDSVVQGGDAVWEGIRVYDGRIFHLEAHLNRLFDSAKVMAFEGLPSREQVKEAVIETLKANGMRDGAHIRLTLTRGKKVTSGMSPHWNQYGCSLIVVAEWKPPVFDKSGLRIITSSIRRNGPQSLDSKIHHNNLINNILAKIEANLARVDEAMMLDPEGYLAETNACNVFIVRNEKVLTPHPDYCLPGITRGTVLKLCELNDIAFAERRLSMAELYTADEAFTTGTMGELTPIVEADGRKIGGDLKEWKVLPRLQALYAELTKQTGEPLPF